MGGVCVPVSACLVSGGMRVYARVGVRVCVRTCVRVGVRVRVRIRVRARIRACTRVGVCVWARAHTCVVMGL